MRRMDEKTFQQPARQPTSAEAKTVSVGSRTLKENKEQIAPQAKQMPQSDPPMMTISVGSVTLTEAPMAKKMPRTALPRGSLTCDMDPIVDDSEGVPRAQGAEHARGPQRAIATSVAVERLHAAKKQFEALDEEVKAMACKTDKTKADFWDLCSSSSDAVSEDLEDVPAGCDDPLIGAMVRLHDTNGQVFRVERGVTSGKLLYYVRYDDKEVQRLSKREVKNTASRVCPKRHNQPRRVATKRRAMTRRWTRRIATKRRATKRRWTRRWTRRIATKRRTRRRTRRRATKRRRAVHGGERGDGGEEGDGREAGHA